MKISHFSEFWSEFFINSLIPCGISGDSFFSDKDTAVLGGLMPAVFQDFEGSDTEEATRQPFRSG
jgi:hypothetical protein